MTSFLFQLLNVHRWLRVSMVLASVWALSANSVQAATFVCVNLTSTFSSGAALKSDGAGGGKFIVSQNPAANTVIYSGTLTVTTFCGATDSSYQPGGLILDFGNGNYTFGGGGLRIRATSRPSYNLTRVGLGCQPVSNVDNLVNNNTASPEYGTYWQAAYYFLTIGTTGSGACTVTITVPVVVEATGTAVSAGTNITFPFRAVGHGGGVYYGPAVSIGAAPTSCLVSPTSATIALPSIKQLQLASAGATSAAVPFAITLSGCNALASGAYLANATWSYTPGVGPSTMANTATSPAGNVEFQLLDSNNNPVANNAVTNIATGITGGTHSKNFAVRYYATGKATPGNVRGVATFNITYQ